MEQRSESARLAPSAPLLEENATTPHMRCSGMFAVVDAPAGRFAGPSGLTLATVDDVSAHLEELLDLLDAALHWDRYHFIISARFADGRLLRRGISRSLNFGPGGQIAKCGNRDVEKKEIVRKAGVYCACSCIVPPLSDVSNYSAPPPSAPPLDSGDEPPSLYQPPANLNDIDNAFAPPPTYEECAPPTYEEAVDPIVIEVPQEEEAEEVADDNTVRDSDSDSTTSLCGAVFEKLYSFAFTKVIMYILIFLPVPMLIVGAKWMDECGGTSPYPLWLVVAGGAAIYPILYITMMFAPESILARFIKCLLSCMLMKCTWTPWMNNTVEQSGKIRIFLTLIFVIDLLFLIGYYFVGWFYVWFYWGTGMWIGYGSRSLDSYYYVCRYIYVFVYVLVVAPIVLLGLYVIPCGCACYKVHQIAKSKNAAVSTPPPELPPTYFSTFQVPPSYHRELAVRSREDSTY